MRNMKTILALTALLLVFATGMASATGSAYFNYPINWPSTPDLYFSVAGGPASTCGDLVINRNGVNSTTPGWLCTDASGNATKGPWSWAGQANDETASAYIAWPGGSSTNVATHVWDKTAPTAAITSPFGAGPTPGSYYGTGSDTTWGACFNASWATVTSTFKDLTSGLYWTPFVSGYSAAVTRCRPATGVCDIPTVDGALSGMPSCSVTWNTTFPPPSAHTTGHNYLWTTCVFDGGQYGCTSLSFTP
ncbi:MAG TPA: hypothetical protein VF173_26200 [Thermoanaerobaculia bacterium]|nr:hypothetical protein [Thermoanaerobaculia bacterium]